MANEWQKVWNNREAAPGTLAGDWKKVFLELKRLNGYDIVGDGIPLSSLLAEDAQIQELLGISVGSSVFEVGCGAGANLYLMARAGMTVGGTDYSKTLIEAARTVLPTASELYCGEADVFPTEKKYDAVFSNGVFPYFPNKTYTKNVMIRMLEKTSGPIGIMGIHDLEKREDYLAYRRANIPDYDERYKGLDKLFCARSFFEDFARAQNLRITFPEIRIEGYWNIPFIFNVFMYRK